MGFEELAELRKKLILERESNKKNSTHDPVVVTIRKLQKNYPLAFPRNPAPKLPLKIGILEDILANSEKLGLSTDEIKAGLKTWCTTRRYWLAITEGAPRIDLDGKKAGFVKNFESAQAKALLYKNNHQQPPNSIGKIA